MTILQCPMLLTQCERPNQEAEELELEDELLELELLLEEELLELLLEELGILGSSGSGSALLRI